MKIILLSTRGSGIHDETMKKTFPLHHAGQADARVLEAIKQEVRKYVKRERRKPLTTGVDFWDFDCQVGVDQAPPSPKHWEEVIPAIEAATKIEGAMNVYVEIIAKPGHRTKKPVVAAVDAAPAEANGSLGTTSPTG